ncbi:MAG: hypothetical protein IPJ07_26510 [Acidobacteria bacterium]|nr:hypothetical protein [Acidobacteriota bacterium]
MNKRKIHFLSIGMLLVLESYISNSKGAGAQTGEATAGRKGRYPVDGITG